MTEPARLPTPALRKINLELTHRCNLRCSFCFMAHAGKLNRKKREMSTREVLHFIDQVTQKVRFYLTGGEPFCRKDCCAIIAHIKERGFACGVNTNGLLLDGATATHLARIGPDFVIFSLHGRERLQDAMSARAGSYRMVVANMKAFLRCREKTQVILTCTLGPDNFSEMEALVRLAGRLGVDRIIFEHLQFVREAELRQHQKVWRRYFKGTGRLVTPVMEPAASRRDLARLTRGLRRLRCYTVPPPEMRPVLTPEGFRRWYADVCRPAGVCSSIWDTMVVEADGDVRMCQIFDVVVGNVRRRNYNEIWKGSLMQKCRRALMAEGGVLPGCVRCCQRLEISFLPKDV